MPGDGMRGFEPPEPPVLKELDGFPLRKKLIFTIAVSCGLVLLAVPSTGLTKRWTGLDMWLSKPTVSGTNPWGTFRVQHRRVGLDSDGTGGVCLIADIARLVPAGDAHNGEIYRGTCTTKLQCNPKGSSTVIWEGYCVPDGPNQPSRCWYRPTDNDAMNKGLLCHTSGNHPTSTNLRGTPWPVGVNQIVPHAQTIPGAPRFDLRAFYRNHTGGKAARWRLSGRLFAKVSGAAPRDEYGGSACLLSVDQKKC